MTRTQFGCLLLFAGGSWLGSTGTQVLAASPDCVHDITEFDGTFGVDLAPICSTTLGGPLSIAFLARVDSASGHPHIAGFHPVDEEGNIPSGAYGIVAFIAGDGSFQCWYGPHSVRTPNNVLGTTGRYMCTWDSTGYMRLYADGSLVGHGNGLVPESSTYVMKLGSAYDDQKYFDGLIGDFLVFHDNVAWEDAVVPATPRDCLHDSTDFDGTFNVNIEPVCSTTFGGALSFTFLARADSAGTQQYLVTFMPVDGQGNVPNGVQGIVALIAADGRLSCYFAGHSVTTPTSVVGLTQRYLCTCSSTGYIQIFVDGIVVDETNGVEVPSNTHMMKLGSRYDDQQYFDGLIEDFYVFHSNVGWDSWTTITTSTTTSTSSTTATSSSTTTISSATTATSTTSSTTTSSMTTSSTTTFSTTTSGTTSSSTTTSSTTTLSTTTSSTTTSNTMTSSTTSSSTTTLSTTTSSTRTSRTTTSSTTTSSTTTLSMTTSSTTTLSTTTSGTTSLSTTTSSTTTLSTTISSTTISSRTTSSTTTLSMTTSGTTSSSTTTSSTTTLSTTTSNTMTSSSTASSMTTTSSSTMSTTATSSTRSGTSSSAASTTSSTSSSSATTSISSTTTGTSFTASSSAPMSSTSTITLSTASSTSAISSTAHSSSMSAMSTAVIMTTGTTSSTADKSTTLTTMTRSSSATTTTTATTTSLTASSTITSGSSTSATTTATTITSSPGTGSGTGTGDPATTATLMAASTGTASTTTSGADSSTTSSNSTGTTPSAPPGSSASSSVSSTPTATSTSTSTWSSSSSSLSVSSASTGAGIEASSAVGVKIVAGIEGVDYATLDGDDDSSARSAFVSAFKQGVLDVLSGTSASTVAASDLSTQLLPARRLAGARALQTAGIQVETRIASSTPEELLSTLQDATESLTTAIQGRVEATVQSPVQITSLTVVLVDAVVSTTTSATTSTSVEATSTLTSTLTSTSSSSSSSLSLSVSSASTGAGTEANTAAGVKIVAGIEGVDYTTLNGDDGSISRSAFVSAFEQGVLDVLSGTSASTVTSTDLSTQLLPARRLAGARALQTAGIQVETRIASSTPEELLSTLQDATESLTTAIQGRVEATLQSTVQIISLAVVLVDAVVSTTPSTSVEVVAPAPAPDSRVKQQVTELIRKVTSDLFSKAVELAQSNVTAITEPVPGGIVTSTKFASLITPAATDPSSNETNPERVVLEIPEADVSVSIPLVVLDLLPPGVEAADVVIGVGVIDPTSEESGLSSWPSKVDEDGAPATVEAVMIIEFLGPDGTPLNISGLLSQPIEFTMQANYSTRSSCVYWDEDVQQWSEKGVRESPKNQVGENIVCETEHLSLFGALLRGIVSAILCSQMSLLNPEGIGNLVQGDWYQQAGATFYGWTLAASFAMFAIGIVTDQSRARRGHSWSAEFFLCVTESNEGLTREETPDDASEGSDEELREGFICWAVCCCLSCVATACVCFKETAARDALDEIMSTWFEQFSEVRTCIEGCWEGLEIASLSAGRVMQMSHSVMCQVTLSSARRLTGASLHLSGTDLSDEVVSFVLEDEDLQDLLMTRYHKAAVVDKAESDKATTTPATSGTSQAELRPQWWTCPNHEEAWFLLHTEVSDAVQRHISNHSVCNLPRMVLHIFLMHNPIGLIFCHDIFFSCKLRSLFHALEIHGSLMVTAVFFAASGGRRGRPAGEDEEEPDECDPEEEEILFYIGRALVVAFGSVLLAGLPVMFLQSLHTRSLKTFSHTRSPEWCRQLRAWFLQDVFIWTAGSLYLCFCTFFVCVFLANVSNEDHEEFAHTAIMCIIQNTVVMPLVVALFVPTVAGILLLINGGANGGARESLLRDVRCTLHAKTNVMLPIMTV